MGRIYMPKLNFWVLLRGPKWHTPSVCQFTYPPHPPPPRKLPYTGKSRLELEAVNIYIYINEICRKPSMWINILENSMVRQLKRLCSWLTVKCTFLLHVSLLLGSFSSCTLYFAWLALIHCCHLCHLPYLQRIASFIPLTFDVLI